MTTALVFSKNRACQLDLLLRSITENAPDLFDTVTVVWKGDGEYRDAYDVCQGDHGRVGFFREHDLRSQTIGLTAEGSEHVAFLMDDCVFYRPIGDDPQPEVVLDDDDVLCFSPRLGLNTTECYPLRRRQELPVGRAAEDGAVYWGWEAADGDFSYPMSLDGHVFRRDDLEPLLIDVYDWSSPNSVEAALARMAGRMERPLMASHTCSSLVGVPANRVGDYSYSTNRHGETYPRDPFELNRAYLAGQRVLLGSVDPVMVDAAHVEFPLRLA